MKRIQLVLLTMAMVVMVGCAKPEAPTTASNSNAGNVTPAEARAIAKEAYVYGFPLVDS